ncbi:hypothetical protein IX38_21265 [Chryseobacterium luteum]|uniref:Uncharacterized protein n=1 Tax=Chryseobacterium luteum TaxID=421531 RepID=A0A085YYC6_9FLAO|nr:hypothetical protein IX38_21265 [Chryseobacterium luteum]
MGFEDFTAYLSGSPIPNGLFLEIIQNKPLYNRYLEIGKLKIFVLATIVFDSVTAKFSLFLNFVL